MTFRFTQPAYTRTMHCHVCGPVTVDADDVDDAECPECGFDGSEPLTAPPPVPPEGRAVTWAWSLDGVAWTPADRGYRAYMDAGDALAARYAAGYDGSHTACDEVWTRSPEGVVTRHPMDVEWVDDRVIVTEGME